MKVEDLQYVSASAQLDYDYENEKFIVDKDTMKAYQKRFNPETVDALEEFHEIVARHMELMYTELSEQLGLNTVDGKPVTLPYNVTIGYHMGCNEFIVGTMNCCERDFLSRLSSHIRAYDPKTKDVNHMYVMAQNMGIHERR